MNCYYFLFWLYYLLVPNNIITNIVNPNSNHTHKNKKFTRKIFSPWREKLRDKLRINFTIIKSITISLMYVSRLKRNLSYFFFFCSHIQSLYVSQLKKIYLFFLCSHTHSKYLSRRQQHFAVSFLAFFSSSFSCPHSSPWLFSRRWQHFALSSLAFFSLSFSFSSSSPWLSSRRRQHFALSSLAFFSSSFSFHIVFFGYLFVALFIYKALFLFSLKLGIHYFFNKD